MYENNTYVVTLFVDENGEFKDQCNLNRMMLVDLLKKIDVSDVNPK